ncbi:MAG: M50 family metallopeptidase [Bacillus sp. (in: Bacteria)]|nr:M50 family metallopeptidase [Bacillus sp. (in: firmicutes)]
MELGDLYYYLLAAFIVSFLPLLRTLFCSFHTLIHEIGHAFAALLTSGKVYKIYLFANTEGLAETSYRSRFSGILIFYFGYTFASLMAVLSFYFILNGDLTSLYYLYISLAFLSLVFWVRNLYGVFWVVLFLGAAVCLQYYQLDVLREVFVLFFSSILLVQSVLSAFHILYLSITSPRNAGDATGLAELTYIPAFIWGLLFLAQALGAVYLIMEAAGVAFY